MATHPSINFKLGKRILNKKKNLFVEKPIVTNTKKLSKLIKIAKQNNKVLMGGYIYLFNSYIEKIKEIIRKKRIGGN